MAALASLRRALQQSARAAGGLAGLRELPCALLESSQTLVGGPSRGYEAQAQPPWCRGLHGSSAALASLQVKVPPLGESISDGTVAAVLKKPGDSVEEDEPIVQLETDKVTVDVRAPKAGTVEAILVKEDEVVGVGHVVASIEERAAGIETPVGAPAASTSAPSSSTPSSGAPSAAAPSVAPAAPSSTDTGGYKPSIHFPPRRTITGEIISMLPRELQAAALSPELAATPPPPSPALQAAAPAAAAGLKPGGPSQLRTTVLTGAPPPPRTTLSEHDMELINLGGAEP